MAGSALAGNQANIVIFAEPLPSWREVAVRETKTKVDRQMKIDNARCKLKPVYPKTKL